MLGYPDWAVYTFAALGVVFVATEITSRFNGKDKDDKSEKKAADQAEFVSFQRSYLVVYLTLMFADWLQGTHMYTLYQSYDVNIGALFLTGFASSAVFGTFIGAYADRIGRKNGCIIFCVLEIVINVLEHVPEFWTLAFGRVLGGISTSLLFSAFESWMVTEHRKRKFSEAQLERTFAIASMGNGLVAVVAGTAAQFAADLFGDIGPFQLAILLTCVSLLFILPWEENYGDAEENFVETFSSGWDVVKSDLRVQLVGGIASLFEGAMYTFVFMWVPVMQGIVPGGRENLPTGLVFSCFMMCISLGGSISGLLNRFNAESVAVGILLVAAVAMFVPVVVPSSFWFVFAAFLVFEVCVGMWFSASGTMRSRYFPNGVMSTVMNIFRVPLNILVVTGTKMTDNYSTPTVFFVCALWHLLAMGLQIWLRNLGPKKAKRARPKKTATKTTKATKAKATKATKATKANQD